MAAAARRNLRAFPDVEVVQAAFEEWAPPEGELFDLVYPATGWGWVDSNLKYDRAAFVLRPGGHLAVWSARHDFPAGSDPFFAEIQTVYDEIDESYQGEWPPPPPELFPDEAAAFRGVRALRRRGSTALPLGQRLRRRPLHRPPRRLLRPHRDGPGQAWLPLPGGPRRIALAPARRSIATGQLYSRSVNSAAERVSLPAFWAREAAEFGDAGSGTPGRGPDGGESARLRREGPRPPGSRRPRAAFSYFVVTEVWVRSDTILAIVASRRMSGLAALGVFFHQAGRAAAGVDMQRPLWSSGTSSPRFPESPLRPDARAVDRR